MHESLCRIVSYNNGGRPCIIVVSLGMQQAETAMLVSRRGEIQIAVEIIIAVIPALSVRR